MNGFNKTAQMAATIMFLLCISGYFLLNIIFQHGYMGDELKKISMPHTMGELADKINFAEVVVDNNSYGRSYFIELYSYLQTTLNKEENGNFDVVKGRDGALIKGDFYQSVPENTDELASRVKRLKDYVESEAGGGGKTIFINSLPMYTPEYSSYSPGLPYLNTNAAEDTMLYYLQSYGVNYMDVREVLKESSLPFEKYRYKTDHHWTVEAGFEIFRGLTRKLNDDYDEKIDPEGIYTDSANYTSEFYQNGFTGSLTIRTGIPFGGRDDFTMITPEFETSFFVEGEGKAGLESREGDFKTAIIDSRYLNPENMYLSYLGGLSPYRRISNLNSDNDLKLLFIHDSFALPVAAFMSSAVSQIDMIYPLADTLFEHNVNIEEYIKENSAEYDYVIVELSSLNFDDDVFSFFE